MKRAFGCAPHGDLELFTTKTVPATEAGREELRKLACSLGLKVTQSGRNERFDRIGFGLEDSVRKFLENNGLEVPAALFKFRRRTTKEDKCGAFRPVKTTAKSNKLWVRAASLYATLTGATGAPYSAGDPQVSTRTCLAQDLPQDLAQDLPQDMPQHMPTPVPRPAQDLLQ